MPLNEDPTAGSAGHIADHAALKAEYVSRGATPAIPDYTSASTFQEHLAIHNALHADYGALGGSPALPQDPAGGHLAHHAALHAAYNARVGYPDASSTGVPAGTTLTPAGPQELNTPGQILDGLDITGYVDVNQPGCIIRNCRITNNDEIYGIYNYASSGAPLLVEDCEIDMQDHQSTGMGPDNFTARRVHIKGAENAFGGISHDVLIEDCFVETIYEGVDGHADCVQVFAPTDGVTIRHNRLYSIDSESNGGSSCIALPQQIQGTCENVTIDDNLVAGGAYAIYGYQGGTGTNIQITGNRFSTIFFALCGDFGPWTDASDEDFVSDNRWHDGPNAGNLI